MSIESMVHSIDSPGEPTNGKAQFSATANSFWQWDRFCAKMSVKVRPEIFSASLREAFSELSSLTL